MCVRMAGHCEKHDGGGRAGGKQRAWENDGEPRPRGKIGEQEEQDNERAKIKSQKKSIETPFYQNFSIFRDVIYFTKFVEDALTHPPTRKLL